MDVLTQLQSLSDEILRSRRELRGDGSGAPEPKFTGEPGSPEQARDAHTRNVYLHLRRMALNMMPEAADTRSLREDWEEVLLSLRALEVDTPDREVTYERGRELMNLLWNPPKKLWEILPEGIRPRREMLPREPFLRCAWDLILLGHRRRELPDARNQADTLLNWSASALQPREHRRRVVEMLADTVDREPHLTAFIAARSECFFEKAEDRTCGEYLWYCAFSLLKLGQPDGALPLLRRCCLLCRALEGEKSWMGARAGLLYWSFRLYGPESPEGEEFLRSLVRGVRGGLYRAPEAEQAHLELKARALLLRLYAERQELGKWGREAEAFLADCTAREIYYRDGYLSKRFALYILSVHHLALGNFLQAMEYTLQALHCPPPPGAGAYPSDLVLQSNLLYCNIEINRVDKVLDLLDNLESRWEEYKNDEFMVSRMRVLKQLAVNKFGLEDVPEDPWNQIRQIYDRIREDPDWAFSEDTQDNAYLAMEVIGTTQIYLERREIGQERLAAICRVLEHFLNRQDLFPLMPMQRGALRTGLAGAQLRQKDPAWERTMDEALQQIRKFGRFRESRIRLTGSAALMHCRGGNSARAKDLAREALEGITAAWQKATAYLDDAMVCRLLKLAGEDFLTCWEILRGGSSDRDAYELVLKFKDLPALVGRERNRFERYLPGDPELRAKIYRLRDEIAAGELEDARQGTHEIRQQEAQLQRLEAAYFSAYPRNLSFTEISLDRVAEKLPESSAILEYLIGSSPEVLADDTGLSDGKRKLHLFLLGKTGGNVFFLRMEPAETEELIRSAEELIRILRSDRSGSWDHLRGRLYRGLLEPVMDRLENVDTVYLAPDGPLCNLPFEILFGDGESLQERFRICRIACGRDLLFFDGRDPRPRGPGFVLGDPDYETLRGERPDGRGRSGDYLTPVSPLPFSGLEAERVARRCGCMPVRGTGATKFALRDALPCGIIHLATHGLMDEAQESDTLYGAQLTFAGYNRWVREGRQSGHCGNGLLTADEISRMDLSRTELVVLSACHSGMVDSAYGSSRGLVSAFSAAGCRWVVSHLWEAYDLATAILMDAFYDAALREGMQVPQALRHAKKYLENVTVGKLRREGWLDPDEKLWDKLSPEMKEDLQRIRNDPDRRRPFSGEHYWGGFVCYKCR